MKRAPPTSYTDESRILKKLIKRKKRECRNKFLTQLGNREPWEVVRIAKDPFGSGEAMGEITNEHGILIGSQEELVSSF